MCQYLDTRDLNKRLNELKDIESAHDEAMAEIAELSDKITDPNTPDDIEELAERREDLEDDLESLTEDELEELEELKAMENEIPEWRYGTTLIPEEDFVDYCEELVTDIGGLPQELPSCLVIDWGATAANLLVDYRTIEYRGTTYLYRS